MSGGSDRRRRLAMETEPLSIPFGQWLTAAGLLSDAELPACRGPAAGHRRVAAGRDHPPGATWSPEEVAGALARRLELPFVRADDFPASPPFLQKISPQYLRQYRFCPIATDGASLTIVCADPTDMTPVDDLRGALRPRRPCRGGDGGSDSRGDRPLLRHRLHRGPEGHRDDARRRGGRRRGGR